MPFRDLAAASAQADIDGIAEVPHFILTLSCQDRRGIVQAVAGFLNEMGCNITESAQFRDTQSPLFFMRIRFRPEVWMLGVEALSNKFAPRAAAREVNWQIHDAQRKTRLVLLVSKIGHCLNDLLFRMKSGLLPIDIVAIVSNHEDFRELAGNYGIPYHYLPLSDSRAPDNKRVQEDGILALIEGYEADLVILARYMQVLTPAFCDKLNGRIINIHHSFLPSFMGGRPYHQAYVRGVKLIGATAHFVTDQLNEGPIIEQDVVLADHTMTPAELAAIGRDAECMVLARAIKWTAEHRIQINGSRTVILR